jgi:hypothetical protein
MTSITVELPDDLAMQAKAAGLLGSEQLLSLFKDCLRSVSRSQLFVKLDTAHAASDADLSAEQENFIQEAKIAARASGKVQH